MSKILISIDVSDEAITDIIDGAEEGGIGYWARDSHNDTNARTFSFTDIEDDKQYTITYEQIASAIGLIATDQVELNSMIRDAIVLDLANYDDPFRMDAECYDVIIQVATFGELVYG